LVERVLDGPALDDRVADLGRCEGARHDRDAELLTLAQEVGDDPGLTRKAAPPAANA
jgi:hypothetical protein